MKSMKEIRAWKIIMIWLRLPLIIVMLIDKVFMNATALNEMKVVAYL